jgi:hypothetical protein
MGISQRGQPCFHFSRGAMIEDLAGLFVLLKSGIFHEVNAFILLD